jgi:FkbM family methyltransferase
MIEALAQQARDAMRLGLFFPARLLWRLAGRRIFTASLPGGVKVAMRCRSTDAKVVRQVFRDREYDFSHYPHYQAVVAAYDAMLAAGEVPVILDLGANIGASALWFAASFPAARIIAVEPDPDNAAMCRRNTAPVAAITTVEAAVGGMAGEVSLAHRDAAWGVRTQRDSSGGVKVRTVAELMAQAGAGARLLMAKIDIEGFESDVFGGDTSWLGDVRAVLIEPHDWMLPGQRSSRNFQRALAAYDFEILVCGENLIYVAARSDGWAGAVEIAA